MKLSILLLRTATFFSILVTIFFLLFSCNSLEFDNHSLLHQEQSNHQIPHTECHQSSFFSISRENILFGLFALLLVVYLFKSSQEDLNNTRHSNNNFFLDASSPPRLHNFYTQLFAKGLLHSKLF